MILVFALAAAVCLQAFVYANGLSGRGEKEKIAAAHAQEVDVYKRQIEEFWSAGLEQCKILQL